MLARERRRCSCFPRRRRGNSSERLYNLPVPFWLYGFGAAATLVLSFVIVGVLGRGAALRGARALARHRAAALGAGPAPRARSGARGVQRVRVAAVLVTGFFGNRNPYVNFSMTFFWVMFVLGFAYVTALIGDLYAAINPWRVIAQSVERCRSSRAAACATRALSVLAGARSVHGFHLDRALRPYAAVLARRHAAGLHVLNLAGVWLVGAPEWFRYCEFFERVPAPAREDGADRLQPWARRHRAMRCACLSSGWSRNAPRAEPRGVLALHAVVHGLRRPARDGAWFRLFWGDPFGIIKTWGDASHLCLPKLRQF